MPPIRGPIVRKRRPARSPAPKRYILPSTRQGDVHTERPATGGRRVAARPVKLPKTFKTERAAAPRVTPRQRRAIDKNVRQVTKRVRVRQAESRRKHFPTDLFRATRSSERSAIRAFSELRLSDPAGYERRAREFRERNKSILDKAGEAALKSGAKAIGLDKAATAIDVAKTARPVAKAVDKAGSEVNKAVLRAAEASKKFVAKHGSKQGFAKASVGGDSSKAATELMDLAAATPTSIYMAGAAAVAASKGDPSRAKKLAKDFGDTSAIPAALSGNWKEAAKRAGERPITTALELSAVKAGVGRGAGAGMRAAPSKRLRKAASLEREPLRHYPPGLGVRGPMTGRKYPKDVFAKARIVAQERRARKRRQDPNVEAGGAGVGGITPITAGTVRATQKLQGRAPKRTMVKRRVDTRVASQERVRRAQTSKALKDISQAAPHGRRTRYPDARRSGLVKRKHSPGVQLGAEWVIRSKATARTDLKKYLGVLAREKKADAARGPEYLEANRANAKHARELLNLSKTNLERVFEAARDVARQEAPRQAAGRDLGLWTAGSAAKRWMPFVQTHVRSASAARPGRPKGHTVEIGPKKPEKRPNYMRPYPGAELAKMVFETYTGLPTSAKPRTRTVGAKLARATEAQLLERMGVSPTNKAATARARKILRRSPADIATRSLERRARRGQSIPAGPTPGGPVLVTQRPIAMRGGKAAAPESYQPIGPPSLPRVPAHKRGGGGFTSREVGPEALARQAMMSESAVTAAEFTYQNIAEFGIPMHQAVSKGRVFGSSHTEAVKSAQRYARDNPGTEPLVPFRIAPDNITGSRLRDVQRMTDPTGTTGKGARAESGRGRWVLLPEDVQGRFAAHERATAGTPFSKAVGPATRQWKDVVLTTVNPISWLLSNVTDLSMRTAFAGITPVDIARGMVISKQAATHGRRGAEAMATLTGGGFGGAAQMVTRGGSATRRSTPGVNTAVKGWKSYRDGVFTLEHLFEVAPQLGAVGKAARQEARRLPVKTAEDASMKSSLARLAKLQSEQLKGFADRIVKDRAFEAELQLLTEDVVGRWSKVSPTMRSALGLAPFAQWLGASTRYVYVTLPVKHPIKTGIMAGINQMTENERKRLGLSFFAPAGEQAQDYQMGMLPLKVGKNEYGPTVQGLRTAHMTSFGTAGAPTSWPRFFAPQVSGPFNLMLGNSWDGERLVYPPWWPEKDKRGLEMDAFDKATISVGAFIETSVPGLTAFRKAVLEKGKSSMPYSNILNVSPRKQRVKEGPKEGQYVEPPGSVGAGVTDWLDPLARGRVVTRRAVAEMEANEKTFQQLEKWKQRAKAEKAKGDDAPLWGSGAKAAPTPRKTAPRKSAVEPLW